jgi:anti-anti-sigma factor
MDVVVAVFTGEYDLSHRPILRVELSALCEQPNLVLDMTAVTYIDSTCITELMAVQDSRLKAGLHGAGIVLHSPSVRKLFRILSLGSIFTIATALDEVLPKNSTSVTVWHLSPGGEPDVESSEIVIEQYAANG